MCSHDLRRTRRFTGSFSIRRLFASLRTVTRDSTVSTICVTDPGTLRFSRARLFLDRGVRIVYRGPLTSGLTRISTTVTYTQRGRIILFRTFGATYLPGFRLLHRTLPGINGLHGIFFGCYRCSSQCRHCLSNRGPGAFGPTFSGNSVVSVNFCYLTSTITLFNRPGDIRTATDLLTDNMSTRNIIIVSCNSFDIALRRSGIDSSILTDRVRNRTKSLIVRGLSRYRGIYFIPHNDRVRSLARPRRVGAVLCRTRLFTALISRRLISRPKLTIDHVATGLLARVHHRAKIVFPTSDMGLWLPGWGDMGNVWRAVS